MTETIGLHLYKEGEKLVVEGDGILVNSWFDCSIKVDAGVEDVMIKNWCIVSVGGWRWWLIKRLVGVAPVRILQMEGRCPK